MSLESERKEKGGYAGVRLGCLRPSIALHPVVRMTVGRLYACPPNHRDLSCRGNFGGVTTQDPFRLESPKLLGTSDPATYGLRTSTKNGARLAAPETQVKGSVPIGSKSVPASSTIPALQHPSKHASRLAMASSRRPRALRRCRYLRGFSVLVQEGSRLIPCLRLPRTDRRARAIAHQHIAPASPMTSAS